MYKARTFIFLLLAVTSQLKTATCQELVAPAKSSQAAAIHYRIKDASNGDQVRWLLLNPFPSDAVTQIISESGHDLIVDPHVGFTGIIRVQVIVTDADGFIKLIDVGLTHVGDGGDEEPQPGPQPGPDTVPEYDGPNKHGIGKVSFDNAPASSKEVSQLIRRAADYLKGYPILKVISNPGDKQKPADYVLFHWLNKEMLKHPKHADWYAACIKHMQDNDMNAGVSTDVWYMYLIEMAEGLERKGGADEK